jgi:uncharacterized membrane protein (UPF0127 family)
MDRLLCSAMAVVFAAALSACSNQADKRPDPVLAPTTATTAFLRTTVPGFGEVSIKISSGPELCALLAQTAAQRARGLMGRTDLAGHVGMLFVYEADNASPYHMKDTPMPLSIAWFDASGRFVSTKDMTPCLDRPTCPGYGARGPYRYALEVPQGGLGGLGVGPGSVLSVGGGC